MKILVITPRLTIAGVPLAQIRFVKNLISMGHSVDFVVLDVEEGFNYSLISGINTLNLRMKRVSFALLRIAMILRTKKPDIVFSAEDHLNFVVILASIISNSKAKLSCSSRVTPFDTYSKKIFSKGWFLYYLMRIVSYRPEVLSCVSEDMVLQYKSIFRRSKHTCIYNIVVDEYSKSRMNEDLEFRYFDDFHGVKLIGCGKLAKWKGFENFILAISQLKDKLDFRAIILGDGPERDKLEFLIKEHKLQQNIKLLGYVDNPLPYFKKSDIFVLSSIVEGMPNVLIESMMCGCIPVANDCPTGPREILNGDLRPYLARYNDVSSLSEKILFASTNKPFADSVSNTLNKFSSEIVISKHFKELGFENEI